MSPKYQRNDPPFFAKFKNWIIANGGKISDRLYERGPGEQTRGVVISPRQQRLATAVFVHGTGNDLTYPTVALFGALFQQNIEVHAFDLDGHGYSGSSSFSAESLKTYLPWVLRQSGQDTTEKVFIIGHSLGGSLALSHASAHPEQVQGLVLISTPIKLEANLRGLLSELQVVTRKSLWQQRNIYGSWGLLPAIGPFKRHAYPIRLKNNRGSYVRQVDDTIGTLKLTAKLDSISCPALLIYGSGDQIVRLSNADVIGSKIVDSELLMIKGATHFSTILEQQVPDKICSFIRKHAHG